MEINHKTTREYVLTPKEVGNALVQYIQLEDSAACGGGKFDVFFPPNEDGSGANGSAIVTFKTSEVPVATVGAGHKKRTGNP